MEEKAKKDAEAPSGADDKMENKSISPPRGKEDSANEGNVEQSDYFEGGGGTSLLDDTQKKSQNF